MSGDSLEDGLKGISILTVVLVAVLGHMHYIGLINVGDLL